MSDGASGAGAAAPRRAANSLDVSRAAGVSRATVSRCFTDDGARVRPSTRARVLAAARTLGYEPNLLARMLNRQQSDIVAVATADFANPFQPALIEAFCHGLRQDGLVPLLLKARSPSEPADELIQLALSYRVSAVVVTVLSASPLAIRRCFDAGAPVLFLNRAAEDTAAISVCSNAAGGAARAADALVDGGARRIAIIGGPAGAWTNSVRRGAFRHRLDERGLDAVAVAPGDFTYESGRSAAAGLLAAHPRLDAIYACNDAMAFGALDAIRATGRRVPDDVAVVGFDDVPMAAWDAYRLSTVRQPVGALVEHACRILRAPDKGLAMAGQIHLHDDAFVHRDTTRPVRLRADDIDARSGAPATAA